MNLFEVGILDSIQGMRCVAFDKFFSVITHLGDAGIFWIILTLILLCIKNTRKIGLVMLVALILDVIICNGLLKPIVNRTRPFVVNPDAPLISARPIDASFPSGHTSASFCCAFALMFKKVKYWIPAMVLSALIAFSRLYLYFHYPTDVIGGVIVGLLCGYAGYILCEKFYKIKMGDRV